MQEAQSRREMKQQRRDAAALEPKQLHSMELSSNVESVISVVSLKDLSIAESSFKSESHASHAEVAEAAPREAKQNEGRGIRSEQEDESLKKSIHHSTVAKNRQKQLQQWAAARPTVPITSSYFTPPLGTVLQPQLSPTRVLLSGLGADELCGGYARYRTAHRHGGDSAARASMKADVDRIWLRNLGRDDRCFMLSNCFSMRTALTFAPPPGSLATTAARCALPISTLLSYLFYSSFRPACSSMPALLLASETK